MKSLISIERPEIDGLKALAVISVILYHGHFQVFSGGFVGVDIFFVVSGYLITTILLSPISFSHFIYRRFTRIVPLYIFFLIVVSILCYFLLDPTLLKTFTETLKESFTFSSNFYFKKIGNDYFFQDYYYHHPLLHTWSLSVEIQTYIFLALITFFFNKNKKFIFYCYIFLTFSSLYLNYITLTKNAFYQFDTRVWQFLVGGLLVYIPSKLNKIFGILGLLILLTVIFVFNSKLNYPLLPVIGAALVLISKPNIFLTVKPMVFIGKMSYSLYLWHWPIFILTSTALYKYWGLPELTIWLKILLSFIISYLSWKFIEVPFRSKKNILTLFLILTFAPFVYWYLPKINNKNFFIQQPFPKKVIEQFPRSEKIEFRKIQINPHQLKNYIFNLDNLIIGDKNVSPQFIIIGDSFASMYGSELNKYLLKNKKSVVFIATESCKALFEYREPQLPDCYDFNVRRFNFVHQSDIKNVIIINSWVSYLSFLGIDRQDLFKKILLNTLEYFNNKNVFIVHSPIPSIKDDILHALDSIQKPAIVKNEDSLSEERKIISSIFNKLNVTIVDPSKIQCEKKLCIVAKDGLPYFHDGQHFSQAGAEFFVNIFDFIIK